MSIRVVLADDHRMIREGLRLLLDQAPDVIVVGEADTGRQAVRLAGNLTPDVLVMDISMPDLNGIEATRRIKTASPQVKVIALSMYSDRRYVLGMFEAGASGYIVKAGAGDELVRAVRAVNRNRKYLSPEIAGILVDDVLGGRSAPKHSAFGVLSSREREVLQLLAEGSTSPQIAGSLHISVKTVEAHRRNLMKKLDLHSVAELTKYAVREGLTSLDA